MLLEVLWSWVSCFWRLLTLLDRHDPVSRKCLEQVVFYVDRAPWPTPVMPSGQQRYGEQGSGLMDTPERLLDVAAAV